MRKRCILLLCVLSAFLFSSFSLHALKPRSKYFKSQEDADNYLTMRYNLGCKYYNREEWSSAASQFEKVIFYFPSSDEAAQASYYLAVCYFEMREYDFANEEFSNYLKASQHPAFFEDAVYYKFCIAEHFKRGKKKRPFKMRYLPKWISAQDSALTIYDEVVIALPNHELTVQALYSKADLLMKMREYRDCVETYQVLIRRFPKHEIVPVCYLNIAEAYVQQSRLEFQNPDILALAELNVRKFRDDFPRDERVTLAEESVYRIKELYAKGLCDLGLFYERIHQPDAAAIYFQSSIEEFPDTRVAQFCRSRLICLGYLEDEPAACVEEAPTCVEETPACVEEAPACVEESESLPMDDSYPEGYEQTPWQVQTPVYQEEVEIDSLPPGLEPSQEYVHYSLTKKRPMRDACIEQRGGYEQAQVNDVIEGVVPSPYPENQGESRDLWHYSTIKRRDQYVPCQD